jgi:hypothetical protein
MGARHAAQQRLFQTSLACTIGMTPAIWRSAAGARYVSKLRPEDDTPAPSPLQVHDCKKYDYTSHMVQPVLIPVRVLTLSGLQYVDVCGCGKILAG